MGNCCGRASSDSNNFSTPGRTLGAVPTNDVPQNPSRVAKPSTTGSENNLRLQGGGVSGSGPSEARAAAARAAEERATREDLASKGKLGQALAADRKQTRTDTLQQAAAEERRRREVDGSVEARNWN